MVRLAREQPQDAPQQSDQAEGADAGNALSLLFLPFAPAPLDADQKTDRQCGEQFEGYS